MNSKLRRGWLDLLLCVLALGSVSLLVATRNQSGTAEQESRRGKLLSRFEPEELESFTVDRGGQRWVVQRGQPSEGPEDREPEKESGIEWTLVEPHREAASFVHVREWLSTLDAAQSVRRIEPSAVDRRAMGLEAPRAVVALNLGTVSYRILIGGPSPTPQGSTYVEVTGDGVPDAGVSVVAAELAKKLEVGADTFRVRKLVSYYPEEMHRVVLDHGAEKWSIRRQSRAWRFDGMQGDALVERRVLARFLAQLAVLDAEHPVASPGAGSSPSAIRLQIVPETSAGGPMRQTLELRIGGRCPDGPGVVVYRVTPDPIAGCFDETILPPLAVTAEQLLLRRAFSLNQDEVEEFDAESGPRKLELLRQGEGFSLRAPRSGAVDIEIGNRRLTALVDARGEWVDPASVDSAYWNAPLARSTLKSSGANLADVQAESVEIGAADSQSHYLLRRQTDGAVLRIDADTARDFLPDATLLQRLELVDVPPKQIRKVEMRGAIEQQFTQSSTGQISLEKPVGYRGDSALAADALALLGGLTAERWVADREEASFGLADPVLSVRWDAEPPKGEPTTYSLRIGRATTGGAYAALGGRPGVFVLARRSLDTLEQLLLDRSALIVDGEAVRRIRLKTRQGEWSLSRVAGSLEPEGGVPPLRPEVVPRIMEALGSWRAEAALHLGPALKEEGLATPSLQVFIEYEPGHSGPNHLTIGAGDSWQGTSIYYARSEAVDATYAVARDRVRQVLDAL